MRTLRRKAASAVALVFAGLAASGCGLAEYREEPLDVDEMLSDLAHSRVVHGLEWMADPSVDLLTFESWAIGSHPAVLEQVARYRASLALVDVEATLADPSVSLGANTAVGPQQTRQSVAFPVASATLPVPLTGRRRREDARDRALVGLEAARLERAARGAVLEVRSLWCEAIMALERERARAEITAIAEQLVVSGSALQRSGVASSLDVALLRLEATRAQQAHFEAEVDSRAAHAALATALAIVPDDIPFTDVEASSIRWLEGLIGATDPEALAQRALGSRTDLAVREAEYNVAETELALQIALQVKDVGVGLSVAPDLVDSLTTVGLSLAGALPLFRRNVQAIATATAERARVREQYKVLLTRTSAEVAGAHAAVQRAEARAAFVAEELVPATAAVTAAAEAGVRAGSASALALLDTTRSRALAAFSEVTARQDVVRAWLRVEAAVEAPILGVGARDHADWSAFSAYSRADGLPEDADKP